VVGDTIISSASWIAGTKKGGFGFYDTCIVVLRYGGKTITVPAARVLSAMKPSTTSSLEEGKERLRPPRGLGTAPGSWNEWCYWVPCEHGRWLYFTSGQMKIKGSRDEVILTDNEVTTLLERGDLYVSLRSVDEIKGWLIHQERRADICWDFWTIFETFDISYPQCQGRLGFL
jgi:hypothetical protein